MYLGRGGFELLRHEPLIDVVEQLIGPEVYSNPVQHIRLKVPMRVLGAAGAANMQGSPGIAQRTLWHQDNAVVTKDADETEMLTVVGPGDRRDHRPRLPGSAAGKPPTGSDRALSYAPAGDSG